MFTLRLSLSYSAPITPSWIIELLVSVRLRQWLSFWVWDSAIWSASLRSHTGIAIGRWRCNTRLSLRLRVSRLQQCRARDRRQTHRHTHRHSHTVTEKESETEMTESWETRLQRQSQRQSDESTASISLNYEVNLFQSIRSVIILYTFNVSCDACTIFKRRHLNYYAEIYKTSYYFY